MADIQAVYMGLSAAPPDTDAVLFRSRVRQQIFQLETTKHPSPNIKTLLTQAGQFEYLREKVIRACAKYPIDGEKYGIELDILHVLPGEDVETIDLDDD